MTKEQQHLNNMDISLLALLGIGLQFEMADQCSIRFSAWDCLIEQARLQTVLPIIYHAVMQLPEDSKPSNSILSFLKSETICSIISNEHLFSVQDELLALLKAENIPCAILKGTSVAVNYPNPELRLHGDIDILVDEADLDRAVKAMERAGFQNCSNKHGFHITFLKDGVRLELHHAISAVPQNKAGDSIIELMQTAVQMACYTNLEKHSFPVLADPHQAVSLLLHMQKHITSSGLGLRQLCDWAMFIKRINLKLWQENIHAVLVNCGLMRFAEILTKTCVQYLGLPSETCPWCLHASDDICYALICDFLKSGDFGNKDTVRVVSSFLVSDYSTDAKKRPALLAFIKNLNKNAIRYLPIIKKLPFLLPLMWVFLTIRYIIRMAIGKRPKYSPGKIMYSAKQRDRIYSTFCLFETDNKLHSSITHEN